jgi:hypothetical protein
MHRGIDANDPKATSAKSSHSCDNGNEDPGGDEGHIQCDTGKSLDEREKQAAFSRRLHSF